jgi:dGTP triphosphohydrolase
MAKEGYKPTAGMQSAARRAIKLKEQGKAKGAGTIVGWTRAGQLARGETLSLSTVKRMYSYFSRHEVDKKGKDWNNTENPSNGKIMWLAWGGDAGFSWSRKIVNREKNMKKSLEIQEVVEEIKSILSDVVEPADKIVEISDDLEKSNAINIPMGEKVENNKVKKESEDMKEDESYESDNEEEDKWDNMEKACWSGYTQEGMK